MEKEIKKTKGRQKIEMKKIEDMDDRLITFSKRRSGIYKKASELATLCGAQVAVVVFSPSGRTFSFGHPSVEWVANRFLQKNPPESHPLVEAHRLMRISELNQKYCDLVSQLEAERERGKVLQKLTKARESKGWWEAPAEKLSFQELQEMNKSFEELHRNLCSRMKEKIAAGHAGASLSFHAGTTHDHHPSAFPASFGYGGKHF